MTQQFSTAAASGAAGAVLQPVAQLEAMVRDIAARREQVQALVAQLNAFDEQLATFERTLVPMLEWSRSWARLAAAADPLGLTRRPPTSDRSNPLVTAAPKVTIMDLRPRHAETRPAGGSMIVMVMRRRRER